MRGLAAFYFLSALCSAMVLHDKRASAPKGFVNNGPAPPEQSITLRIALASNNIAGLESKLLTISDPSSADYGQWLSQAEVKSFVEPTDATKAALKSWSAANGLTTTVISANDEWVSLTTTVLKANSLFKADLSKFTHIASQQQIFRTLSYSLPPDLVNHVNTIHPMTAFSNPNVSLSPTLQGTRHMPEKRQANTTSACPTETVTITPACLSELYGIPTTPAKEKSQTLLVTGYIGEFPQKDDLSTFLSKFQPNIDPNTTFNLETLDGGQDPQGLTNAGLEGDLDVQYTTGIALSVPITFLSVGGGNSTSDFNTALLDTTDFLHRSANPPAVMTTSYGENEVNIPQDLATQICNGYMAVSARGVSVIFASGDGGVRGNTNTQEACANNTFAPEFPAECPYITAVGATAFTNPEFSIDFTGGGFSNFFPRPSYQDSTVLPFLSSLPANFTGIFNRHGRGYPDVSAQGVGLQIVFKGNTIGAAGTSASAPIFASIIALINDRLITSGKPVLGFLNPWLYSKASSAFTDITLGTNPGFSCPDNSSSFSAGKGWDPVSGFGTPLFAKLLEAAGISE